MTTRNNNKDAFFDKLQQIKILERVPFHIWAAEDNLFYGTISILLNQLVSIKNLLEMLKHLQSSLGDGISR